MFFFQKIIILSCLPLMIALIFFIIGIKRKNIKLISYTIIILYILSTPLFSKYFFKIIEGPEYRKNIKLIPKANAIVVLSGNLEINDRENDSFIEWGDPDRLFGGIELYSAGKALKLIFTGGRIPWNKAKINEGNVLKEYAITMGIPKANILVGKDANNTYEEAITIKQLLNYENKIILVTSAFHMSRAKKIFEKMGFKVIPFKVDYKTSPNMKITILDFFPNAESLELTETGMRELFGRIFYILFR